METVHSGFKVPILNGDIRDRADTSRFIIDRNTNPITDQHMM